MYRILCCFLAALARPTCAFGPLLGAIAAALPRPHRTSWLVTPVTLLRW